MNFLRSLPKLRKLQCVNCEHNPHLRSTKKKKNSFRPQQNWKRLKKKWKRKKQSRSGIWQQQKTKKNITVKNNNNINNEFNCYKAHQLRKLPSPEQVCSSHLGCRYQWLANMTWTILLPEILPEPPKPAYPSILNANVITAILMSISGIRWPRSGRKWILFKWKFAYRMFLSVLNRCVTLKLDMKPLF